MQNQTQSGLEQLRDIHLPAAIDAWPPAIGWWLLPVVIILLLALVIYSFVIYRRKTAAKRQAMLLLEHRFARFKSNKSEMEFLAQCNQILKRYCLHKFPHACQLTSDSWIEFLNQQTDKPLFSVSLQAALAEGVYKAHCEYQPTELYQACKQWIKSA